MQNEIEKTTGSLFGSLWKNLNSEQFKDSVELFTKRAIANDFDLDWLKDCMKYLKTAGYHPSPSR